MATIARRIFSLLTRSGLGGGAIGMSTRASVPVRNASHETEEQRDNDYISYDLCKYTHGLHSPTGPPSPHDFSIPWARHQLSAA